MNTTTKVILGMTVAAAAGAAIGMLLAPEKGSDLQKKIKDGAKEWLKEFNDLLNTGKEAVHELKSKAGQEINTMRGELSEFVESDQK